MNRREFLTAAATVAMVPTMSPLAELVPAAPIVVFSPGAPLVAHFDLDRGYAVFSGAVPRGVTAGARYRVQG